MDEKLRRVDPAGRVEAAAAEAAEALERGECVIFPSETVYGVAADALSEPAVTALAAWKGRAAGHAFTVHLPEAGAIERYAAADHPLLRRLAARLMPGPLTLVVPVDEASRAARLAALGLSAETEGRIYHAGAVALRVPDHPLTRRMLAATDHPIVATVACRGEAGPPVTGEAAVEAAGEVASRWLDGGPCCHGRPSTVVRLDGGSPESIELVRPGVIESRLVAHAAGHLMLFVCSGNTCRSPMAAALARELAAEQAGCAVEGLAGRGVEIASAGVSAGAGAPAAAEAVETIGKRGGGLAGHRARRVDLEMLEQAHRVFVMTQRHAEALERLAPSVRDRVLPLDPEGEISDPIGAGVEAYERCAGQIEKALRRRLPAEPI